MTFLGRDLQCTTLPPPHYWARFLEIFRKANRCARARDLQDHGDGRQRRDVYRGTYPGRQKGSPASPDDVARAAGGRGVNFQVTVLKILVSYPDGFATMADLKRDMAILATSGVDWAERTRRLAARVPDLDIFSQRLVTRENGGWKITERGRSVLVLMDARPGPDPVQAVTAVENTDGPMPPFPPLSQRAKRRRERRKRRREARQRARANNS